MCEQRCYGREYSALLTAVSSSSGRDTGYDSGLSGTSCCQACGSRLFSCVVYSRVSNILPRSNPVDSHGFRSCTTGHRFSIYITDPCSLLFRFKDTRWHPAVIFLPVTEQRPVTFHKLEFLLKYGYLPTDDDARGKNLPKELQGLKDFLNKKNNNYYYILQRNPTERYSFSWQGASLNVTRQRYYPSLAEVRCGFVGAEEYRWRAEEITESVTPDAILNILTPPGISPSSTSESSEIADQINTEEQENISPSVESPRVQPETEQQTLRGDQNITESAELERKKSERLSSLTNFIEDVERNVNSLNAEVRAFNENKSGMLTIIQSKHDVISNLIEITDFHDFMKWVLTEHSSIMLILKEKQCCTKYLYKKFGSQLEYMANDVWEHPLNIKSEKGIYTACWDKKQLQLRIEIDDQAVNNPWDLIGLSNYIVNNGKSKDDVTNDVNKEKEELKALISTLNAHGVEVLQTRYRNEFLNIQENHELNSKCFDSLKRKFDLSQENQEKIDLIKFKMARIEFVLENLNKQIDLISPQFTEVAVGAGGDREGAGAPAAAAPAEDRRP